MKRVTVEVSTSSLVNFEDSERVESCVAAINDGFAKLSKIDGFPSRHIQIGDTIFASLQEGGVVTVYSPVAKKPTRPKKSRVSQSLSRLRKIVKRT